MFESLFTFTTLALTISGSIPYILAAIGGTFSEKGGVVNISLEGMLLGGAFATTAVTLATGNPIAGLLAGAAAGIVLALLHAVSTVTFGADQIITGLAVNFISYGATKFGAYLMWNQYQSEGTLVKLPSLKLLEGGGFAEFVNTLIGNPIVVLTILLVVAAHLVIFKTKFGLRIRSVGVNPEAAETLGVSVHGIRYACLVLSGAIAGLGGAWLAFYVNGFYDGMSAGKGFIAMAAVVFGKWTPVGATLGCLVFGFSEVFQQTLQRSGQAIPSELVQTLPYVLTILALVGLVGRAGGPAALGKPHTKFVT